MSGRGVRLPVTVGAHRTLKVAMRRTRGELRVMRRATRIALGTITVGFLVEAVTEAYQFVSAGYLRTAWIGFYYVGLVTTAIGFYLIYRGRQEWTDLHRLRHGHRLLAAAAVIFIASVGLIAVIASNTQGSASSSPPVWLVALVGGLVALSLGNFFLGLFLVVFELVGPTGRYAAWGAFLWSLGVAVLAGFVVGEELPVLLHEFLTQPLGFIAGFAPLAFLLSPLFVTYGLFAFAYWDALRGTVSRPRQPVTVPVGSP